MPFYHLWIICPLDQSIPGPKRGERPTLDTFFETLAENGQAYLRVQFDPPRPIFYHLEVKKKNYVFVDEAIRITRRREYYQVTVNLNKELMLRRETYDTLYPVLRDLITGFEPEAAFLDDERVLATMAGLDLRGQVFPFAYYSNGLLPQPVSAPPDPWKVTSSEHGWFLHFDGDVKVLGKEKRIALAETLGIPASVANRIKEPVLVEIDPPCFRIKRRIPVDAEVPFEEPCSCPDGSHLWNADGEPFDLDLKN